MWAQAHAYKYNYISVKDVRKVISEVYTSLVLQCKHKTDVEARHGIHHSHKKSMKYSGHRRLLCELSKLSKFNAFNLLGY